MKPIVNLLIVIIGLALVTGAVAPSGNDKDMIVRLQGEVLVLQRQIRDLQESIDRSHAVSLPKTRAKKRTATKARRRAAADAKTTIPNAQFCTTICRMVPDASCPCATLVSTALTKAMAISMVQRTEATTTKLSIRMTVLRSRRALRKEPAALQRVPAKGTVGGGQRSKYLR